MIQELALEKLLNFDPRSDRLHLAFSPSCPNFRTYLAQYLQSNLSQQFLFLSGDVNQIPPEIQDCKVHFLKGPSSCFSETGAASILHLHWSFEPKFLNAITQILPRCFVLISYLVDDYHTSRNLPIELIEFADQLVLTDIPMHLLEEQNSRRSKIKIVNPDRSGMINSYSDRLDNYQARVHIWAHPAVGSIIDSEIDAEDPRFNNEAPDGSWLFRQIFPALHHELEQSRASLYPDRALESDEILKSNARILLDLGLERFQAEFPQDHYLRYLLAICLMELGEYERAEYLLLSLNQIQHPWRVRLLLGQIQSILGDANQATDHLSSVLAEYPECKLAKEALRKLLLTDTRQMLTEQELSDPAEEPPEIRSRSVVLLNTFDSELFCFCRSFFKVLLQKESYIACQTAAEVYQRIFRLSARSLSAIQLVLCDEATPHLEEFLDRQIEYAVIVNNNNTLQIEAMLPDRSADLPGNADQLAETLFLLSKRLKLDRLGFIEIPESNLTGFERLDIQNAASQRFIASSKKFIMETTLAFSAEQQSELDFYKRALKVFPELRATLEASAFPEILQVLLQKNLKNLCLLCPSLTYVNSSEDLLQLSNERLHRQAVLSVDIHESIESLEVALQSETKRTRLKQFDYILLAGYAEQSMRVKKLLRRAGLSANQIILTYLNSYASDA